MPRFFLHQTKADARIIDHEGADFADLYEARTEAVMAAREIMGERIRQGESPNHSQFVIADSDGQVRLVLPFIAVLTR